MDYTCPIGGTPNRKGRLGGDHSTDRVQGHKKPFGITALLADGFDVDQRDPHQWSPLMRAAANGKGAIMAQLAAGGAHLDATNLIGETPLYLAAESGRTDALKWLLDAGADPTIASTGPNAAARDLGIEGAAPAGTTPLAIAQAKGHAEAVALLTP